MRLSRRDMFKLGGLAAVGAAGLAIPLGHTVSGSARQPVADQQDAQALCERLRPARSAGPGTGGGRRRARSHYYDITAKTGAGGHRARACSPRCWATTGWSPPSGSTSTRAPAS